MIHIEKCDHFLSKAENSAGELPSLANFKAARAEVYWGSDTITKLSQAPLATLMPSALSFLILGRHQNSMPMGWICII